MKKFFIKKNPIISIHKVFHFISYSINMKWVLCGFMECFWWRRLVLLCFFSLNFSLEFRNIETVGRSNNHLLLNIIQTTTQSFPEKKVLNFVFKSIKFHFNILQRFNKSISVENSKRFKIKKFSSFSNFYCFPHCMRISFFFWGSDGDLHCTRILFSNIKVFFNENF